MFRGTTAVGKVALTLMVCGAVLLSQHTPATPARSAAPEFPVTMRQKLTAGVATVGTKVQAKLVIATLVNGMVVPRDAVLSGEVTESVAKSGNDPSRLAIRMNSVQWKNETLPLKVYLTAWYYPTDSRSAMSTDPLIQPADAARSPRNWNGVGSFPDPNTPTSQTLPNAPTSQTLPGRRTERGSDSGPAPWDSPASGMSNSPHRVLMKNVESQRNRDGTVSLICKRSNIKIDKETTYVLAPEGLLPAN
jgi:hypothetical protein